MIKRFAVLALLPLAVSGCAGSASLSAIGSQTPAVLGEIEQLKTAVSTAPLAGCVATVQQADMLLKALATGTPAIPISPTPAPPIVTVTPPPPVITPPPAPPPPVVTPPPGGPIVTPNARTRRRNSQQEGWPPQTAAGLNSAQLFAGSTFYFDANGQPVPIER